MKKEIMIMLILSFILLFLLIYKLEEYKIKQDKILFPTDADTGE